MLGPEPLRGKRIVADPAALDALLAALPAGFTGLRFAPDEAFVLGLTGLVLDDEHAIVEDERGYVAIVVDREVVDRHLEWAPPAPTQLAQGAVAGVPAMLVIRPDGRVWIVTHTAYVDELMDRLT